MKAIQIAQTLLLFAGAYLMFFEFPKAYNEVPLLKINEVIKWICLIACILEVIFLFGVKKPNECDKK